ncbi:MAG: phosphate signaling complex protein PhoU [Planctomycetaceae bacterium]|jgi:phosphate transport system protein|nr:phosphate signaling complex protein PhoU [Planctomycetaceae bacterium]
MSIHLVRDLDSLHRLVLTMCARVEDMIHAAVATLHHPDYDRAREIVAQDDDIDTLDVEIEEECLKLLALHQPVAIDLRRITTVMKISAELERVADLGVSIAQRALGIISSPELTIPETLQEMSRRALDMLHQSIDAYVHLDVRLARQVCQLDEAVDALNREIIAELTMLMRHRPDLVEPAVHLFSAARQVERIADHATNIAEDVVYLVQGEIIRHRNRLQDQLTTSLPE